MNTKSTIVTILYSSILISACIDVIDFEAPDEYQDTTVIIGKIVKGNPSTVEVFVQNLFDFAFQESAFIIAQSVRIVDESGNKLEVPVSGAGRNKLLIDDTSNFKVEIGNSYSIEVDLFDGKSFKSDFSVLPPVPKMEAFEVELVNKEVVNRFNEWEVQPRLEYRVNTSLMSGADETRTSLRWEFSRTYKITDNEKSECYFKGSPDVGHVQTLNVNSITASSLSDFLLMEQDINPLLVEGQHLFAIQESLDDNAIEFWEQVNALSTNSGTFYEAPPGQVITNIMSTGDPEDRVFGHFYATEHDTLNVFVDSTFINVFRRICPKRRPPPGCDECCDCTQFGSTIKPAFWKN